MPRKTLFLSSTLIKDQQHSRAVDAAHIAIGE